MGITVVTEKRRHAAPFKPYADEKKRFDKEEGAGDWHAMCQSAEVQQRLYWRFWMRRAGRQS